LLTHYRPQRCRSETENFILEDFFGSVLSQFKKYHPSGNMKFNNLGIFQNLKLPNFMVKILRKSLKQISLQIIWGVMGLT